MDTTATEMIEVEAETAAQALLDLLALRGVEYFFANSGTDFASICDAFAMREKLGKELPRPVLAPHEIPLMSMAHGYYLATGKPQVAMVHVGVGTANCLGSIINASKGRVPILFFAGRTSITEEGQPSSRSAFIHWGQESFDQAAAVREYVKWDYELRNPGQLETVIDRAIVMAMSEPRGPIYLTMPPEVLAASPGKASFRKQPRYDLPTFYPDPAKIELAADCLARARFPLIITSAVGRSHRAAAGAGNARGSRRYRRCPHQPGIHELPAKPFLPPRVYTRASFERSRRGPCDRLRCPLVPATSSRPQVPRP